MGSPTVPPSRDSGLPDLVGPGLRVLFCGINPGLRSAELGLHFARPGNRFWKLLHQAGLTDRLLQPAQQELLPSLGIGITNLVRRPSAAAAELTAAELTAGAALLADLVTTWAPAQVAVLGIQAYRTAFRQPRAAVGRQPVTLAGAGLWVLPNPSGLQARYQLPEMVALCRQLREQADAVGS